MTEFVGKNPDSIDTLSQDSNFSAGFALGLTGEPFPLKAVKNVRRSCMTPQGVQNYENGYITGLGKRIDDLKIKLPIIEVKEDLSHIFAEDEGIKGLNMGLARSIPSFPESETKQKVNTAKAHYTDGYKVGWAIVTASEYGNPPILDEIPQDDDEHAIYVKARNGDFKDINYRDATFDGEIKKDRKRIILRTGISHWLFDKQVSLDPELIVHFHPLVRLGFASAINNTRLSAKDLKNEYVRRGAIFARKILEIKRTQQKNGFHKKTEGEVV